MTNNELMGLLSPAMDDHGGFLPAADCQKPGDDVMWQTIEGFIDNTTLMKVVDTIGQVCLAKAEHIEVNHQDQKLAARWAKAGQMIFAANTSNL